ncbi:MAG TPA: L-aspartate oxidase [Gemmatimonadota bacterium]|nr:L-aspartate oxidase [Gemmatimonadota bacterium]
MRAVEAVQTDVLVVGSGIAGLTFALKAAEGAEVLLLTKKGRVESNTNYAQGGVAAAVAEDDSPALHRRDTLLAGAGLCHTRAVEELAREGPDRVRELAEWGVRFSREDGGLALGREAGHSRRRILHAADLTGREIERALLAAVAENPRIRVLDNHFVWELLTGLDARSWRSRCTGALALDVEGSRFLAIEARAVLLATGGSGRLYRHTTNPPIATGDGIAIGYEAGAAVANLEFVQFHPTALYPAGQQAFLISEALRGEGAVLRTVRGRAFLEDVHPAGSLAPRDIVARAIDRELRGSGVSHVVLDLSDLPPGRFRERFPNIARACAERGLEVPDEPIPVVPAAHYQCGGLLTDWDGRTSLRGLYAAGEVACTGVHGANRLASNSLLEAVVYAHRAARRLTQELPDLARVTSRQAEEPPLAADGWEPEEVETRLREVMWSRVGIVRSDERLDAAREAVTELAQLPVRSGGTGDGAMRARECGFLARVASLVVRCALRRRESRGLHFTESHPHRDSERYLRDTVLAA